MVGVFTSHGFDEAGVESRFVYLPQGAHWIDAASGQLHEGGWTVEVAAPLERRRKNTWDVFPEALFDITVGVRR